MPEFSLRTRIVTTFLMASSIPFLSAVLVSNWAIGTLQDDKLETSVAANLHQVRLSVEKSWDNLNLVSQQLTSPGISTDLLNAYLAASSPAARALSRVNETNLVDQVVFTNPNIGLVLYWLERSGQYDFESSRVKQEFSPRAGTIMKQSVSTEYHAPHPSQDQFSNRLVLSVLRKVETGEDDGLYLYLEAPFPLEPGAADQVFDSATRHLMIDANGIIVYTENPAVFPLHQAFVSNTGVPSHGLDRGHYWALDTSPMGWSVVSIIPKMVYDTVRDRWLVLVWVLGLVFLAFALAAGLVLWRWVYRPLRRFDQEMDWLDAGTEPRSRNPIHIKEFDLLLERFQSMKQQVISLLDQIGQKERRRADLEIEKLRFQINPHFLLNSLNTIHWHATLRNDQEIDQIVVALMRLLQYNLSKDGPTASVAEELAAVEDYVTLQKSRYDFRYVTTTTVEPLLLSTRIPRFILQPLVENAIAHGLREGGTITVAVDRMEAMLELTVKDEGGGPTDPERSGSGLGLDYVRRMMESFAGAQVRIESRPGAGTCVTLAFRLEEGQT